MSFNFTASGDGKIFQLSVSKGGVPKLALRQAQVTDLGIEGDEHRDLKHHGGPERALCLYSLERIMALQAEGHPIFPGAAGENVTVSGLDWERVVPGTQLLLGENVVVEVTNYTVPCNNIRGSFAGGDFMRIDQDRFPGWSRVYAKVVQGGEVVTGDRAALA